MELRQDRPPAPRWVAVTILLWSILSFVANAWHWHLDTTTGLDHTYSLDLGAFGFLASIGLWRLSNAGRIFALVLTWYWLLGAALLYVQLFPGSYLGLSYSMRLDSHLLEGIPQNALRLLVVPFFLVQLWQHKVLVRPDVRTLFSRRRPPAIPSSPQP